MNEVKNTLVRELTSGEYVAPMSRIVYVQPEGIICSSVGSEHEGFGDGGEYDL